MNVLSKHVTGWPKSTQKSPRYKMTVYNNNISKYQYGIRQIRFKKEFIPEKPQQEQQIRQAQKKQIPKDVQTNGQRINSMIPLNIFSKDKISQQKSTQLHQQKNLQQSTFCESINQSYLDDQKQKQKQTYKQNYKQKQKQKYHKKIQQQLTQQYKSLLGRQQKQRYQKYSLQQKQLIIDEYVKKQYENLFKNYKKQVLVLLQIFNQSEMEVVLTYKKYVQKEKIYNKSHNDLNQNNQNKNIRTSQSISYQNLAKKFGKKQISYQLLQQKQQQKSENFYQLIISCNKNLRHKKNFIKLISIQWSNLQYLNLSLNHLDSEDFQQLVNCSENFRGLKELVLLGNKIEKIQLEVFKKIQQFYSLQILDLRQNHINDKDLNNIIVYQLQQDPRCKIKADYQKLQLFNFYVKGIRINKIANFIKQNKLHIFKKKDHYKRIILGWSNYKNQDWQQLIQNIHFFNMFNINLCRNNIKDVTIKHLQQIFNNKFNRPPFNLFLKINLLKNRHLTQQSRQNMIIVQRYCHNLSFSLDSNVLDGSDQQIMKKIYLQNPQRFQLIIKIMISNIFRGIKMESQTYSQKPILRLIKQLIKMIILQKKQCKKQIHTQQRLIQIIQNQFLIIEQQIRKYCLGFYCQQWKVQLIVWLPHQIKNIIKELFVNQLTQESIQQIQKRYEKDFIKKIKQFSQILNQILKIKNCIMEYQNLSNHYRYNYQKYERFFIQTIKQAFYNLDPLNNNKVINVLQLILCQLKRSINYSGKSNNETANQRLDIQSQFRSNHLQSILKFVKLNILSNKLDYQSNQLDYQLKLDNQLTQNQLSSKQKQNIQQNQKQINTIKLPKNKQYLSKQKIIRLFKINILGVLSYQMLNICNQIDTNYFDEKKLSLFILSIIQRSINSLMEGIITLEQLEKSLVFDIQKYNPPYKHLTKNLFTQIEFYFKKYFVSQQEQNTSRLMLEQKSTQQTIIEVQRQKQGRIIEQITQKIPIQPIQNKFEKIQAANKISQAENTLKKVEIRRGNMVPLSKYILEFCQQKAKQLLKERQIKKNQNKLNLLIVKQ